MTTGKVVKLIGYINLITEYLRNGVIKMESNANYYDDDDFYDKSEQEHKIIVDTREARHSVNAEQYSGPDIYVHGERLESKLKELSGDNNAFAIMREEYSPYDSCHKEKPEYEITLCIDNETIVIDENEWR